MNEVVFVSQSVTANYHSFPAVSSINTLLVSCTKPASLMSWKHTSRSANTPILLIGRRKEPDEARKSQSTARWTECDGGYGCWERRRAKTDSDGTRGGGRWVMAANSPWDKYWRSRTKEPGRRINEKEREAQVGSSQRSIQKILRKVRKRSTTKEEHLASPRVSLCLYTSGD